MKLLNLFRPCLSVAFFALAQAVALANPGGGVVVAGAATFGGSPSALTINQNSSRAVIDWNSFSIGAGQSTTFRFYGPAGAGSAVLNRVSPGAGPTIINGLLNSFVGGGNVVGGSVYLINPSGLLIGARGAINVGSFVGTTLSVDNSSFMQGAGALTLGGPNAAPGSAAAINNQGNINALGGDIFLIAQQVENSGSLSGNHVGLAAGSYVQINQPGQPGAERISILAGNPSTSGGAGVQNTASGVIQAVTAELAAAGGNIYALAIRNDGMVHANTITSEGGHIYLTAGGGNILNTGVLAANNSSGNGGSITINAGHNASAPSTVVNTGSIEARGEAGNGGTVEITGDQLTLASGSLVDVSGRSGGGTALIGGGPHGADASVPNASRTTVAAGAVIDADALSSGQGGQVVVWGTDSLQFDGAITARGGAGGGNGGQVEVSGHNNYEFSGTVDTSAPHGSVGHLLIDPTDLTIDNNNTGDTAAHLYWGTLTHLLTLNDVSVTTVGSLPNGADTGALTTAGSVDLNSIYDLTLQAQGLLTVGGAIRNSLSGSLTLDSVGAGITIGAPITLAGGGLTLTSAGAMAINYDLTAGSVSAHSGISGAGDLSFGAGVTVQADSQSYQAGIGNGGSAAGPQAFLSLNTPNFWNSAGTASAVTFGYRQDGSVATYIPAASQFFNGTPPANYSIRSDGGNLTINTGADLAGSALTLQAHGTLSIDDDLSLTSLSATANAVALNGTGGSETITTTGGDQSYMGTVTLGAATTLNSGTIELAAVTGGGFDLTLNNTGVATLNGAESGLGTLTASGSGTLVVNNTISGAAVSDNEVTALNGTGGAETLTTVGGDQDYMKAVTLGAATTLNSGTIELAGVTGAGFGLTLNNTGAATLNGAESGLGTLTASGSGTLAVDNTISGAAVSDNEVTTLNGTGGAETITTTAGDQDYMKAVTLGAATTLNSGTIELAGVTGADFGLTLNNTGAATLNGAESGLGTLTASGSGTLVVDNTIFGAAVSDNEVTTLNGTGGLETITTAGGDQDYTKAVTLGAATILNSGTIELAGVTGGGFGLTLNNTGVATLNGAESGLGTLTAGGSGTLVVNNTISGAAVSDNEVTTLNGTGGAETITTLAGDQDYTKAVTLGAATTLNSGTIELAGVTGAGFGLTLNNTGVATLNGAESGLGTLTASGSGTLAVDNTISGAAVSDNEMTTLNGTGGLETITTLAGDQDYMKAVTLGAATILNSGTIELAGVTGGGFGLTLNNTGVATLNGAESGLGTLTASGSGTLVVDNTISGAAVSDNEVTALNGAGGAEIITTLVGDQDYMKAVTLGAATTLNSGTIELAGVTGAGFDLTLNNTGVATLNGAESGVGVLTASASAGASLTVDNTISAGTLTDNQATTLNGTGGSETITTTGGDQDYTKGVTLGAPTILNSGTIELAVVTGGGNSLTLNNTGAATLNGAESGLGTLTASGSGTLAVDNTISGAAVSDNEVTALNGTGGLETITTLAGDQDYTKAVTLGAATILNSGTIELAGVTGGGFDLTLNNTGVATLSGAESGLGTLTASGSGTLAVNNTISGAAVSDLEVTTLNGTGGLETITTIGGDQDYTKTVTLGGAATLNSGTIELAGVTGGGFDLTLNNTGMATLNGAESGLGTLTASGSGTLAVDNTISGAAVSDNEVTTLNGTGGAETITTLAGDQDYTKAVTLGAATALNSGTIELAGVTGAGFGLTLNNTGAAMLNGAESGLGTLTASGSGTLVVDNTISGAAVSDNEVTTLNGTGGLETITTIGGDQDYTKAVTLGAATMLNSATIELAGVTGAGFGLTLNNTGVAMLNGAESGLGTLTASDSGTLVVNNTISGAAVSDNEVTTLNGTGGAETITTTGGDQDYTKTVTLGGATTLNSGTIELAGVTGGAHNLTLNNTGAATLSGAESGLGTLTASGSGTLVVDNTISGAAVNDGEVTKLNGTGGSENITTSGGGQTYGAAVTLGANTTVNDTGSGNITFGGKVDADLAANDRTLTVESAGTTTFKDQVGGVQALQSLTVDDLPGDAGGAITLGNAATDLAMAVTTQGGGQQYGENSASPQDPANRLNPVNHANPVTLGANTTLSDSAGGNIVFDGKVDAAAAGAQGLAVNTAGTTEATGNTIFNDQVGSVQPLASLSVDAHVSGEIILGNPNTGTAMLVDVAGAVTVGQSASVDVQAVPGVVVRSGLTGSQSYPPAPGSWETSNPLVQEPDGLAINNQGEVNLENVIKGIYNTKREKIVVTPKAVVQNQKATEVPPGEFLTRSGNIKNAPQP